MPSVKKNFMYSTVLTGANYIFPFITYPYVSRVLGVTNIGVCNFVDSIIHYFILFSVLGIGTVGIREVARCRDDRAKLSSAVSSLIILNTITTSIALIVLIILTFTVPKLNEHRDLMLVGGLKLVSNYLLIEWAYKGLENFKFITIRTLVIRIVYVISVFIFIKDADDYPLYFFLGTMIVVVNACVNIVYIRKFISYTLKNITFRPYLSSFFILGFYGVLTSMYISFNVAYLGFVTDETQVGYYTTATKLYNIVLSVFTALTGVMMPRMTYLVTAGRMDEFRSKLSKSLDALLAFTIPAAMLMMIFAPEIIMIISGPGYEGAITPMRIVMPLMIIIGYEQILIVQTLFPLKADKSIFVNSVIGASVGILFNILLVGSMKASGSAMVWIVSEVSVLIAAQMQVKKLIGISFPYVKFVKNIASYLPAIIVILLFHRGGIDYVQMFIMSGITLLYCYVLQVYIFKNEIVLSIVDKAKRSIIHRNL